MFTPQRHTSIALSVTLLFVAVVLAAFATTGFAQAQGSKAGSAGSARFVAISNIDGFSGFFNVGQGTVRIVAIVSPTSADTDSCLAGLRRIFADIPSRRLRAYIVFVPVSDADTQREALMKAASVKDGRVACFWDTNRAVLEALLPVLGGANADPASIAVFDTDAVIRDTSDAPTLSMSTLQSAGDRSFDADALEAAVVDRLEAFEKQQSETPATDAE